MISRPTMTTLIKNKKVTLNYEILEKFEGGLVLEGFEVKSLKQKHGKLDGAYVVIRGNEAFLVGASIPAYQPKNTPESYDPARTRKILIKKKEITRLLKNESQKGLTLVPMSLYNKNHLIKLEFAVARGKKKHDKRNDMKDRDVKCEIERTLKSQKSLE